MPTRAAMLAVAAALLATPAARADPPRFAVYMGQVATHDAAAGADLESWVQFTERSASSASFDVLTTYYPGHELDFKNETLSADLDNATFPRLQRDQESIYVVSAIAAKGADVTEVDSKVYLGDLQGKLTSPMLDIHQRIKNVDFRAATATVAAITLFGLGTQALDGGRPAAACAIFRKAGATLTGVDLASIGAADLGAAIGRSKAAACPR